jgi:MFS family permease
VAVVITQIGDWLYIAALGWYVLEAGGNAAEVTGVAAAGILPQLFFTLAGGVAADRWAKRNVLRVVVMAQFVLALTFATLVALGYLNVFGLGLFAFIIGSATAIWQPIYLSFIGDLVPAEHLEGAMGLSMGALYTARAVGPAVAGVLIAAAGTHVTFFVNAATFLAPVTALWFIRTRGAPTAARRGVLALLGNGVRAVAKDGVLGPLWLLTAALSLFAMPVFALMPVFARDEFGAGALTLGALLTAAGIGQLLGAAVLALGRFGLSRVRRSGLLQLLGCVVMGLLLAGFGLAEAPLVASLALFAFNFVYGFLAPRVNAIVQSRADAERGTAQALFLVVFGLVPIGQVALGRGALEFGAGPATVVAGLIVVAVAVLTLATASGLRNYVVRE